MTKNYLLILSLLLGYNSLAQQIELQGTVLNPTDKSGIHVFNKNTNYNTITNQEGEFTIDASMQDTLVLSSITYSLKLVVVDAAIYNSGRVQVMLEERLNELDEVVIGNQLSGDLKKDIKMVTVEEQFNFDDVGIPGFLGKPQEKIVPIVPGIGTFTTVDLEAMYKHLSGYYRKLRLQRKWEAQNIAAVHIMAFYTEDFFVEAYQIPKDRLYDFMLYCIETTTLQEDYNAKNYPLVLKHFEQAAVIYRERLVNTKD